MTTLVRVRLALVMAAASLCSFVLAAAAQPQPPIVVKDLVVEGNRRVQEAVILGRIKTAPGGPFNASQASEDVRTVFALGFFDDVQLRVDDFEGGVRVTFTVSERPFVRDVGFIGHKELSTTELQDKIDIKLGSVYNPVDVQRAREQMKEAYEESGYFEVQIAPEVEQFSDGDVKVVFNINEGRRITIDEIVIRGNTGLTARQIKRAMATQERQYYILRGTVQRQRLEEDIERIVALYNDHGYIQARVDSHDIAVDRDRARVTVTIDVVEGPQFRVGEIKVTGVTLVPESEVRRQLKLKGGDVFSRTALRESTREIAELYSTIGRASVDIVPRTDLAPGNHVTVALEITEGPEVYVERINIAGNVRSEDKILRREIPMVEGDLFTSQKLRRAQQRLTNLGYFEAVNVTTQPGTDLTRIIVNVDVTERPTGLFSIGGGYSSVDSFVGTIDLRQNNFLGRGWQAALAIRAGGVSQQGILSFTEPWLFDRPLSAGIDLFSTARQYTEYDYTTLGGVLRLSHPFAEYWRWHLSYRLTHDEIDDVARDISSAFRDEIGTRITSLVSAAVTRDSRDSVTAPTSGGQTSLVLDVAGVGGDSRFVKTVGFTTYFKPIWFDHILSGRLEAGYGFGWGGEELPLFERFYMGGPNSFRGVKSRRISPIDEHGTRIGGTSEVLGNIEYIVPLPFNLRVAGFVDIGNVYGFGTKFDPTDLREAAGGGIRWISPFGPIRVDYGINLDRRQGEDFGALHFSMGSPF
ncbi:MAG TPA: outer membrane protein assembly factor BamA [Candidatus Limnocylindria bacterium]|nr:outer membrane protein assembly factor BamA [Candidatus Limnocylindria bacterium]